MEEKVNIYVARYIANITLASNLRSSQMGIKLEVAGPQLIQVYFNDKYLPTTYRIPSVEAV